MRPTWIGPAWALSLVAGALLAACGGAGGPAGACTTNSSCDAGYACVNSACTAERDPNVALDSGHPAPDAAMDARILVLLDAGDDRDADALELGRRDLGASDAGNDASAPDDAALPDAAPDAAPMKDVGSLDALPDATPDAPGRDADLPDAAAFPDSALPDAAPRPDAESADTGAADAEGLDAAALDATARDAAAPDAAAPDAAAPDAAAPDAAAPDAAAPDARTPDPDAAADAAARDAAAPDAAAADAAAPDAAPRDAAAPDAAEPDASAVPDAAAPDAAALDASAPDASALPDAAPDAAADAQPDAAPDAAADAQPDAAPDAAPDATADATFDAAPDASALPDAEASDAATKPDLGVFDDAAPADAGFPDTGVHPDAAAPDADPIDAGFPDTGIHPDAAPIDAGPVPRGIYAYRRILISGVPSTEELTQLAISPDGRRLVVSETTDKLHVLAIPAETSTITLTLPKDGSETLTVTAIAYPRDGSYLLVSATAHFPASSSLEGRLYRAGPSGEHLAELRTSRRTGLDLQNIAVDPTTGAIHLIAYRSVTGAYNLELERYDDTARRMTPIVVTPTSAGCQDLVTADDGLGGRGQVFACGINGGVVGDYDSTGGFNYGTNPGNVSHLAVRPQSDYAIAINWSGEHIYRFRGGAWTIGFNTPTEATERLWNITFSDDGARALIVGGFLNTTGGGPHVSMIEYRHDLYTTADLTNVSIPNFDQAPWQGISGVNLNDAAFRPGSDCGYAVGGCSSFSCTRGYLIGFSVLNGRLCP